MAIGRQTAWVNSDETLDSSHYLYIVRPRCSEGSSCFQILNDLDCLDLNTHVVSAHVGFDAYSRLLYIKTIHGLKPTVLRVRLCIFDLAIEGHTGLNVIPVPGIRIGEGFEGSIRLGIRASPFLSAVSDEYIIDLDNHSTVAVNFREYISDECYKVHSFRGVSLYENRLGMLDGSPALDGETLFVIQYGRDVSFISDDLESVPFKLPDPSLYIRYEFFKEHLDLLSRKYVVRVGGTILNDVYEFSSGDEDAWLNIDGS
jgi:hypothetical protein